MPKDPVVAGTEKANTFNRKLKAQTPHSVTAPLLFSDVLGQQKSLSEMVASSIFLSNIPVTFNSF